jgi:hypothetical protein
MSCCEESDRALGRVTRVFLWLLLLGVGGFVLGSLPELKRYIKISSM